jgi:hypothetical protein
MPNDGLRSQWADDALNETTIDGDYDVGIMSPILEARLAAFAPTWHATFQVP